MSFYANPCNRLILFALFYILYHNLTLLSSFNRSPLSACQTPLQQCTVCVFLFICSLSDVMDF